MNQDYPFQPFPFPVVPPTSEPTDSPVFSLCFNYDWQPFILGALKVLARPETWIGTEEEVNSAVEAAMGLLTQLKEGCAAMQFRQDTDCTLQMSIDGINWSTIFDAQECINHNLRDGTLSEGQGAGSGPIEQATCTLWHAELNVAGQWILPTTVSAGDTITVSNVQGGWADGWLFNFWFCANGQWLLFGNCETPATPAKNGDPEQSLPHMNLLAKIDSVYHDGYNTTITVPSGVSNAQVVFVPNDDPAKVGGGAGTIHFDVEYCAHATSYHLVMGIGAVVETGDLCWHVVSRIDPNTSPCSTASFVLEDNSNNCVSNVRWVISNMTGYAPIPQPGCTNNGEACTSCAISGCTLTPDLTGGTAGQEWQDWFNTNFASTNIGYIDIRSLDAFEFDICATIQ